MTTPPPDAITPETPAAAGPTAATDDTGPDLQAVEMSDVPPLSFVVPESFHGLPIAATPEERAALAEEFVREMYPEGNDDLWTPAAPYYAALGEAMGDRGLAYSAMGLFSIDEGIAHCSFTVAAIASDHPSPEVAALGIREILVREETNDARWLDLPCGPAVSCVTLREYVIGAELTASGKEVKLQMGQVQVYVPFPTGPYTAVFTLDTAAVNYWGEFSELTMAILRSVSFADDDGTVRDGQTVTPTGPGAGASAGAGEDPGPGASTGTGTGTTSPQADR
ncbi:hypothetical protein [Streptomyces sp. CBMA29]|uniref:hypothetical protein n=1 Tax=Streptomyces sp. CBMA29 TaxID=1896314 RepID=UPI001661AFD7|nr:hypothetical protein [Streptomyces sp. CBMA29]MBD0734661.1 hypothetical protein [Streptomyces sp. CBMA29]